MLTLDVVTVVVLLVVTGVACALGGYAIAQGRQRRAGDGKSAAELKSELSQYKENVAEHFQTTASLLHDMTEQYRSVYEHMAGGAQQLCDAEQATVQIESLKAGLLPVLNTPSEPAEVIDSGTDAEQQVGSQADPDSERNSDVPDEEVRASVDELTDSDAQPLEERQDDDVKSLDAGRPHGRATRRRK
ncbi:MAG: uncharacterized membrane-anchored protein YhcB (DUF1043 family) [Gammaproteobacteria bacterium]|jgi:uncharacterized membrane-anchored protein YhcB (DUF1043 family)